MEHDTASIIESPFAAIKAQQQHITSNGIQHDSGVEVTDVALTPTPVQSQAEEQVMSLDAEEAAGGPPLPSIAAPAISAVRDQDGDTVMHEEVDGRERPADDAADKLGGGGAAVDQGMPGDARQLGLGPETDERAPPMTADVEQPTASDGRTDIDMSEPLPPSHPIVTPALSNLLAPSPPSPAAANTLPSNSQSLSPVPLPPTLAPSTAPGPSGDVVPSSAVSNATAPPTPGGAAETVAAHAPAPEAVLSPPSVKRSAEDDDVERDVKRQKQESVEATVPMDVTMSAPEPAAPSQPLEAAPHPEQLPKLEPEQPYFDSSAAPVSSQAPSSLPPPAQAQPPSSMPGYSESSSAYPAAIPSLPNSFPPEAFQHPPRASEPYAAPSTVSPAQLASPYSGSPTGYVDYSIPPSQPPAPTRLPKEHQKFAESTLKQLKKMPASLPFLNPVDPVALNIPTYRDHIKEPMDLGTVEKKLKAHEYTDIHQWVADVRLIWANCYRFNGQPGPNAPVSISAKVLETSFEKAIPKIPIPKPPKAAPPPKAPRPIHIPKREISPNYGRKDRRPSGAVPTIRRTSMSGENGGDGKRTIRAPQPYEPDYDDSPMSARPRNRQGRQTDQMRFCRDILKELMKKSNESFTWPFLRPVDYVALNIPDYPRIVKRPIDLGTIRQNFDRGDYRDPEDFAADMRLLCRNCFAYNPAGTPVNELGRKVEHFFESKWMQLPEPGEFDDYDEEEDDKIRQMEAQLAMMRDNLQMLKGSKRGGGGGGNGNLSRKNSRTSAPPPRPADHARRRSTGLPNSKIYDYGDDYEDEVVQPVAPPSAKKDEVSFEMKRELATKITTFEGYQLEKAIEIIRTSAPELLGDESKEIELDIDQLDDPTLLKLYQFVVLGKGQVAATPTSPRKRQETLTAAGTKAQKSGRAGTGGLKGAVLDEDAEAARIAALEQKLQEYQGGGPSGTTPGAGTPTSAPPTATPAGGNGHASDWSSDEGDSSDED